MQSARVSSDPSRKLLEDSGTSPEASASISSGRGVLRKSSRRRRDFSKAFSKAADGGRERKIGTDDNDHLFRETTGTIMTSHDL